MDGSTSSRPAVAPSPVKKSKSVRFTHIHGADSEPNSPSPLSVALDKGRAAEAGVRKIHAKT